MADIKTLLVPDIGDFAQVDVIEILVKPGDVIAQEDALVALETDKATMEVPATCGGKVTEVLIKVGDKVSQGDALMTVTLEATTEAVAETPAAVAAEATAPANTTPAAAPTGPMPVVVPDIGDFDQVDVIEVFVAPGDTIEKESPLIALETDKATMEVPAPSAGTVVAVDVKVGDKVAQGDVILTVTGAAAPAPEVATQAAAVKTETTTAQAATPAPTAKSPVAQAPNTTPTQDCHAGPATRRLARELGVDLGQIKGSGAKDRILKSDVKAFAKQAIQQGKTSTAPAQGGMSVLPMPTVDFSQFGEIEVKPLNRIKQKSGANLHRNWVMLPHVTQFDEADITELEAFRQANKAAAQTTGVRLTPLAFFLKAAVCTLQQFEQFNSSLSADGKSLVYKKYYHIGVAVDTPQGLVVPVLRDVDKKGVFQIARELDTLSTKARAGQLTAVDMQGSCFTISSLGGISGTGFTPIINAPDVAIMGIAKAKIMPQYIDEQFVPRRMLPFSLSYDHRVIDGAEAARFTAFFAKQLQDIRNMLL